MKATEHKYSGRINPYSLELTEYGDFSCPRCRELQKVLTTTLPLFEGQIRYTFRHFPNLRHPQAVLMAMAAEAARRQGRYKSMHQALFANATPFSLDSVTALALAVGLDRETFLDDIHDETLKYRIWADMELGRLDEVVAAPTLFLGVYRLHGKLTQARLIPLIRHYVDRSNAPVLDTVDCENGQVRWSGVGYD